MQNFNLTASGAVITPAKVDADGAVTHQGDDIPVFYSFDRTDLLHPTASDGILTVSNVAAGVTTITCHGGGVPEPGTSFTITSTAPAPPGPPVAFTFSFVQG